VKTRVIVLKRIRAGDQDLLAKVYGQSGVIDLLVRDGLLSSHRFFGLFEPFNILRVDLSQRGGIVIPNDVDDVQFVSYLSRDINRFLWMSWICGFILRNVSFYEEKLFNLFVDYMLRNPKGRERLLRVRLKLDYLIISGLKPKILDVEDGFIARKVSLSLSDGAPSERGEFEMETSLIRLLKAILSAKKIERLRVSKEALRKIEDFLDAYIDYHTR
jgi:recombinational DNA repair protein (RecF pathway)